MLGHEVVHPAGHGVEGLPAGRVDALAAGLLPGRYDTLNNPVGLDETGRRYNPQTGYLGGAAAGMIDCMNYLAGLGLLSVEEMEQVGFYNPLRLIGMEAEAVRPMREVFYDEARGRFEFGEQL